MSWIYRIIWAMFFFAVVHQGYASDQMLCDKGEHVILACPVDGVQGKKIAICGGRSEGRAYIEYRFGTSRYIEMKYRITSDNHHVLYRGLYDGTYSVFFGFFNGEFSYIVEVPQEVAGARMNVVVRKNGKRLATVLCKKNDWVEDKNVSSPLITDVDGEFLMEGKVSQQVK